MKLRILSVSILALFLAVNLYADEGGEDLSQGWSPAINAQWMEASIHYAKAIQTYGEGSPEATQAQVERNTLARRLGIKPSDEIPQVAPRVVEEEKKAAFDPSYEIEKRLAQDSATMPENLNLPENPEPVADEAAPQATTPSPEVTAVPQNSTL